MNNIRMLQGKRNNNACYGKRDSYEGRNNGYLSDEALEKMIAATEKELLHPPKEFKNNVLKQIRKNKKRMKDRQLFSYSMKVIAAAAAALGILLIVPDTVRLEERFFPGWRQDANQHGQLLEDMEKDAGESDGGGFYDRLNKQMDEYCNRLNTGLDRLVRMEVYHNEKEEK